MVDYLKVRIIPRAKENQISAVLDDGTFKIRVQAPPTDGKANKAVIKYLSKILDINRSRIHIVSGEKARTKKISFNGYNLDQIESKLLENIE